MISQAIDFFRKGIWEVRLDRLSKARAYVIGTIRIFLMAGGNLEKNDCQRNATVLTYYSVLNIVPLFAVVFAVANGFGLEKFVVRQIFRLARDANLQPDVTSRIIDFSRSLLTHAKGEIIVGVGVVILFWTIISILGKIEDTFNVIWGARQSRTVVRKLTDYLSMLILGPVLLALWSSVNILIVSELRVIMRDISLLGPMSAILFFLMKLLPFISIWLLLLVLYLVMPNTRVSVRSSVFAAIVTGSLIQVVQWVYIRFQIGVSTQSAIYGSFAAIPLFLAWLQVSWIIVIFGAEIANSSEHYETYGFHPDYSRIGEAKRRLLMLRIFHLLVKRFDAGEKPLTSKEIGKILEIPEPLVREILVQIVDVDLVSEITKGARKESRFQPARSVNEMTIKNVLDAYEKSGEDILVPADEEETDGLARSLRVFSEAMENSPANVKLKDI
ncbi:MAG TPA: YihY/virulence factor BrkB family protein [Syntrophorhabdaceae bacterium]|nr:YihY/virulence factor BrkB family protein [Syntrophorhabdaceae bacterium]